MSTTLPIILGGMHRSGTSYSASVLHESGVFMGEELLGPHESNRKGHYENVQIMEFHRKLLRYNGCNHDGWVAENKNPEFTEAHIEEAYEIISKNKRGVWGWKEPRTILFLDFWHRILPEAAFVFVFRSPALVIDSLFRRGDEVFLNNPELAIRIWQYYNQLIIQFAEQNPDKVLVYNVEDVIAAPDFFLSGINKKFNLSLTLNKELFEPQLYSREDQETNLRKSLIYHFYPEAVDIENKLKKIAEKRIPDSSLKKADPDIRLNVFYDWMKLRQAEKELKTLKKTG